MTGSPRVGRVVRPDRTGYADPPPVPDPLPLPVVDNHAHLDMVRDDVPSHDLATVLGLAQRVGVDRVVHIACDLDAIRAAPALLDSDPRVLGGMALHPNEVPALATAGELDAALAEVEALAAHPRVRVIGETGLDYFRTAEPGRPAQQESFRAHLDLARRTGKALQIHDRDAHDDVLRILAQERAGQRGEAIVMHCFSGDMAMARECAERGYFLSFSGTVTFKGAGALRDALAMIPLDRVLVETDAPFLTPHPHRGAANASYLIPLTVRVMAMVLNVSVPVLCQALSANAERLYGPW
ncbi:MAG: TatD family hydrolase [Austwickia sp.]|nr:TatD family hydrolase [Austwickia sp.]